MKYRDIERLAARTSLLGFGAMRLPLLSEEIDDIDQAQVREMVDVAIAGGVNFFDTAYAYHKGKSESALHDALVARHDRSSYYLSDKLAVFLCNTQQDQEEMFRTQLERCGVEYFDFYLLHAVTDVRYAQMEALGSFDFARRLRDAGKIRRLGFSYHGQSDLLERVLDAHPDMEFILLQLNYLDWDGLNMGENYRVARERELPVMIMEPVKGGSLASLPPKAVALREDLATASGQAAFAFRFAASLEGVFTVLSGMSATQQVRDNVHAFSHFTPFTAEDEKLSKRVLEEIRAISQIPCTTCGYCVESCPAEIEIPRIFSIYNEYKRSGVEFQAKYQYSCILPERRAESCIACGACRPACPQNIDIPAALAKIPGEIQTMALVPENPKEGNA